MIIVANQPVQLNRSEWSDFEWYWLQQLQNRPTRYVYQSMDHLRFEWDLRGSLVEAAEGLDRSGVSFASFEKSRCNPAYWNRNAEGGFELRSNVTPADGIRDIWRNGHLYAFECATATVIVLYGGVLGSIREDAFNSLFRNLLLFDWHYDSDLRLTEKTVVRPPCQEMCCISKIRMFLRKPPSGRERIRSCCARTGIMVMALVLQAAKRLYVP